MKSKSKTLKPKKEFIKLDYTLEQYFAERKQVDLIIKTLSDIAKVTEKLLKLSELHDIRLDIIERKLKEKRYS
jgi:hypothetical protein